MIRLAREHDAQRIEQIAERAYRPYVRLLGKKPAPMIADFRSHIAEDWVIVFERGGMVLGYAIICTDDTSILLDNIAVDSESQKQGVGQALLDHVERRALQLGYAHLDLYTNVSMTSNIRWYQKLGFTETKRVEEKGFKRVYMRKCVAPEADVEPARDA